MSTKGLLHAFTLFALTAVLAASTVGQGTTSRVTGTITDNNGAAVPGATVSLTNEQTQVVVATATTSSSGVYLFDLVQPGSYKITVEKEGFKRYESTRNTVLVNQPATINVAMEVGDVSAVVSVEATAEQVQTASSGNIGATVEQRTIESLPIVGTRGRNPLDLLYYQPGVVSGSNTGGGVHVNGSRDRAFNFTLDGIDINESTAGGSNFTPLRPNPDSIQEFQVVTSGFTAELGRSSGAQVTMVTRSGTNDFRGSLFEFYQSKGMMARSYAVNVNGGEKENFIQHIFGGSFSGPLFNPGFGEGTDVGWLRDRAFFFVNLQMLRASDTLLQTRTVYTPLARQGIFRWVQGRANGTGSVDAAGNPVFPACGVGQIGTNAVPCIQTYDIPNGTTISLDPFLMDYINAMPLPNSYSATGDGLNIAGFQFNAPQTERQWDFVTKFDFKLNEENSFYVRWAQGEQNTFGDAANGGRQRFPDQPNYVDTFRTPKNLAVNWRSSPTAKFVNEFIVGYSHFGFNFLTPEPDPFYAFIFNLPTDPNTNFSYNARSFRTWQFVDNMTFDLSPHVIKAGTNLRLGKSTDDRSSVAGGAIELAFNFSRTVNNNWNFPTALPTSVTGSPNPINSADRTRLENMINDVLGRVGTITQAFVNDPNNPNEWADPGTRWLFDAKHPELDFYVQDSWRARNNLVLDFGVRLEARFNPTAAGGRPILVPDQPVVLGAQASNALTWTEGELFGNKLLLLPTAGFAWDPFGDGKTSIRANYRKASDRFATFLFSSFIFQSTPGNNALGSNTAFGANGGLLRDGLPSVFPTRSPTEYRTPDPFSTVATTVFDPDIKFPSIHNWTLSFQRELFGGNVLEVNYIGKKATNLFGGYNANQVDILAAHPSCSRNFLETFIAIQEGSTSECLTNLLFSGSTADADGTARFRALNGTAITQGSAATLALAASQQTCVAAFVTAGLCTNAQLGQRILDLRGFSDFFQPFSQFTGGMNVIDSNDFSFYNGLEFTLRRRMRHGVSFNIGYTWSVSKDTRSYDPAFATVSTGSTQAAGNTPLNNYDRKSTYAWSDFDRRHTLLGTYVVELPFGKGRKFRADNSILNYAISGWQIAGTLRFMSGRPFTVFSGLNTVSNTSQSYANCDSCPRDMGGLVQGNFEDPANPNLRNWWFTEEERQRFSQPGPGEVGNTGRNYFIGPSFKEADISLLRKFHITERVNFDVRIDARNFTNTPNFAAPTAVLPSGLAQQADFGSSIFGRINADVTNNARRVQISGRLNF